MSDRLMHEIAAIKRPVPIATPDRTSRKINLFVVGGLLAVAFAIWPLFNASQFYLTIGTLIALNVIGATSLHLVIRSGHISLAHAGFMGVGGYACVLSVMLLGVPPMLGLFLGAAASALLALAIGPIILRLTGKYFVLVTFLLGEILRMIAVEWVSLTGGSNGIFGVPPLHPALSTPIAFYYVALVFAVLCVAFCARLLMSPIGRFVDALREGEPLARSSGVPVLRLKVTIFAISCALVGLQGGLLAHFLRYIDPNSFSMVESLNFVVMNVIGGMYHLSGPIIGTIFIVALPEFLRGYVELQRVIFGIILIIVMAALPGGMVEVIARLRRLASYRSKGDSQ